MQRGGDLDYAVFGSGDALEGFERRGDRQHVDAAERGRQLKRARVKANRELAQAAAAILFALQQGALELGVERGERAQASHHAAFAMPEARVDRDQLVERGERILERERARELDQAAGGGGRMLVGRENMIERYEF